MFEVRFNGLSYEKIHFPVCTMLNKAFLAKLKSKIILGRFLKKKVGLKTLPLIYPEKKLCLFVNEKAGCTFAIKWFFFQQGILEDALAYNEWIHKYRYDIYYKQDKYRLSFLAIDSRKYTRIKLVRSPYQRAVSSYIHAVKTNYAGKELSQFLGREITPTNTFTFEEFVAFLEQTGVRKCNPHHRIQAEKAELTGSLKIDRIIRLEDSYPEFRRLENDFGLKASDLDSYSHSLHHRKRVASDEYCGNKIYPKRERTFSEYQAFYNAALMEKIANIYACDFKQYNYPVDEL